MNIPVGIVSAVLGCMYLVLAGLAALELITSRKQYGVSRFGVGYILMAVSCGPHHLLHAGLVFRGEDLSIAVAAATFLGVPSGVIFVGLRIEAMFGGRGDRFVTGTPLALVVVSFLALFSAGLITASAFDSSTIGSRLTTVSFLANAFVTVTYALVSWPLLRTQLRQRHAAGGWSLAGLAVSTIFPTCALMHLVDALDASGDIHTKLAAIWGVPASVYFLWVVRALHKESIIDWNSRPAAGNRRLPPRAAPWDRDHDAPIPERQPATVAAD